LYNSEWLHHNHEPPQQYEQDVVACIKYTICK